MTSRTQARWDFRSALWCVIGVLAVSLPASAQVERSGGGSANAQMVQQYQQAAAESARLQGENGKLKSDLEAAQKQLKAAQQAIAASRAGEANSRQAEVTAVQAARDANAKSLDEMKKRMQEIVDRYRELAGNLKTVEADRNQLQQRLSMRDAAYDNCAQHNLDLYMLNTEILDRAAHRGGVNRVALDEPFTRIARTRMDNMITEYRIRADEIRMKKDALAPAAGSVTP